MDKTETMEKTQMDPEVKVRKKSDMETVPKKRVAKPQAESLKSTQPKTERQKSARPQTAVKPKTPRSRTAQPQTAKSKPARPQAIKPQALKKRTAKPEVETERTTSTSVRTRSRRRPTGRKRSNSQPLFKILGAILVVELLAAAGLYAGGKLTFSGPVDLSEKITSSDIKEGQAYLESLKSIDIQNIIDAVSVVNKEKRREALESNPNAVWSSFDDAVIVGDSRVVGFWFWEFLPESRAISEGGAMVRDIPIYLDRIVAAHPDKVFLAFGLNDYGIGEWPDVNDYTDVFVENVNLIKEQLPAAEIYVNSTLPAVGVGLDASPAYPRIPEYNAALKEMCEREGYHYIDNDFIAQQYEYLYNDDGLHLQEELYLIWATNMLSYT